MDAVNLNGKIVTRDKASLTIDDHSYRYGDGLFETIKVKNDKILLSDLHFERLFNSIQLLNYSTPPLFNRQMLAESIIGLCRKNHCGAHARVRLSVSPGHGGLYDMHENFLYLIEAWPLPDHTGVLNENGLVIDIFPKARKSCDAYSNLKSASHLVYAAAARFAKENKWNECLLLNTHDRICDSTIANVFWVKDGTIYTPPLNEGAVAGVMRKYLVQKNPVIEKPCTLHDIETAEEVFLTNAIQGIRWVSNFRTTSFTNSHVKQIIL